MSKRKGSEAGGGPAGGGATACRIVVLAPTNTADRYVELLRAVTAPPPWSTVVLDTSDRPAPEALRDAALVVVHSSLDCDPWMGMGNASGHAAGTPGREAGASRLLVVIPDDDAAIRTAVASGADDFVVESRVAPELAARAAALLARPAAARAQRWIYRNVTLDGATRTLRAGAQSVVLSEREAGLLRCLLCHPGMVLTREQLLEKVWVRAGCATPESNVVDVYVVYLRRRLAEVGGDPAITAVRGVGYSLA